MRALAELCIRRPVFTWVLVLACAVLGLSSVTRMPVERFPNVDFPFVSVTVLAPGMSAEQVETEISARIENALGTVGGLDRLDSISSEGSAVIYASFVLDKNSMEAANEVRDRISRLADELPPTAKPPRVETWNINGSPIVLISMQSPNGTRTPREVTELADTGLRRELQSIKGVGDVRLLGGETRTLSIVLDPLLLHAADLTAQEVQQAFAVQNLEAPGGSLLEGEQALGVRLKAKARNAAELEQVVVAQRHELAIRVRDIGRVEDDALRSDSRASLSGAPAVVLAITKQPGANTIAVTQEIRDRLAAARDRLPDGVEAQLIQDNSEDIRAAVQAVTQHLILGALLAAAVVLLFLRSWRAMLIAGMAIPTSILGAFAAAHALGVTLNLLSMLGLTLAVGIVIDDAIVVLENIARTMEVYRLPAAEAAAVATREIGLAVMATTMSLVAVFLPVATMQGIVGRYLAPFGLTMSVSILLSMGVAFTLTPMLCSRWLRSAAPGAHTAKPQDTALERLYGRTLTWLMQRRWVAGITIAAALVSTVPLAGVLPATFLPIESLGRYTVYARLPESASIERTEQVGEEMAALLRGLSHTKSTAFMTLSARELSITAYLDTREQQAERIAEARQGLSRVEAWAKILIMVSPSDDMNPPGPDGAAVQYVIRGPHLDGLQSVATQLLARTKSIPGTVDHGITSTGGKPELLVQVERAHASLLGVSQAEIGSALALADHRGVEMGSIRDAESRSDTIIPLRLRAASATLNNEDLVRALGVRSRHGNVLSLAQVAKIGRQTGPGSIRRVGRQRQITLFMNTVPGTSDAAAVEAIEKALREVDATGVYRGEVIGNAKEMEKAFAAFITAIVLSLVFMYLVLAAQFESWLHPVTILMSLPLTIPFGLLSLWVGGQSLNLFSALGFLVLFGVVKKNSILQIDRILHLRSQGIAREQAVQAACHDRLRPILMTTLAFLAGMLPLVLSSEAGAATNRAIAVGVMGGQALSLGLTLLATPIMYLWLDDLQGAWHRFRGRTGLQGAL